MPERDKRAALYLRVSTGEQTTENQRLALTEEASRRGWTIAREYEDAGISGAKGREKRPGLDSMLLDSAKGKFDVLMVWSLDRLGRSLVNLLEITRDLEACKVDLYCYQQSIDTTTPAGRLFFHIVGAMAQYERELIRERTVAGIMRARSKGKHLGRPTMADDKAAQVRALLLQGIGINRIAKQLSVGNSAVERIKKQVAVAS